MYVKGLGFPHVLGRTCFGWSNGRWENFHYPTRYYSTTRLWVHYPTLPYPKLKNHYPSRPASYTPYIHINIFISYHIRIISYTTPHDWSRKEQSLLPANSSIDDKYCNLANASEEQSGHQEHEEAESAMQRAARAGKSTSAVALKGYPSWTYSLKKQNKIQSEINLTNTK